MQMPYRLIALTLALAFPSVIARVEAKGDPQSPVNPSPAECLVELGSPAPTDPKLQPKLDACGWALLRSLTGSGGAAPPQWETWQTKEDVGLDAGIDTANPPVSSGADRAAAFEITPRPLNAAHLLSSLREPLQRHGNTVSKHGPQLAQVLYNSVAANYIHANIGAFRSNGTPLQLPAGSVIAKTVWAPIDLNASAPEIFSSNFTSLTERSPTSREATNVSNPYLLDAHPEWTSLTLDEPSGKPAVLPCALGTALPQSGTRVSSQCLHAYTLDPKTESQALATLAASHDVLTRGCQRCLVALVGVNMMIRPKTGEDWIWLTLWWNGRDNGSEHAGSVLASPWKYYEINVTNALRQRPGSSSMNIIFDPSLEGMDTNGRVSNCRSCHTFAASSKTNRADSMSSCGAGPTLGSAPVPTHVAGQAAQQQAINRRYLAAVMTTDSVWSLAGTPIDPAQPNASLQVAGCQPAGPSASASLVHP